MQAFAEGMVLATKGGIAPEPDAGDSRQQRRQERPDLLQGSLYFARDFETNFATKWMAKDVGLALESAKEHGCPAAGDRVNRANVARRHRPGWGDDDFCSVIRVLEDWAGVAVKKS